jgi:hypothetical protein
MGTLSAGSNGASSFVEVVPLPIPVDKDAALGQDAIQKKWRTFLDPAQEGNVDSSIGELHQAGGQSAWREGSLVTGRDQQVEV